VSAGNAMKIAALLFVVTIMQVSAFSSVRTGGAAPDILLVTLVAVALLRGSITGAVAGFLAGLVVDITTLGTLGLTSLLLTLAGYWAGRYGETTGRGRPHAPLVATVAATVFVELGGYCLDSLLGGPVAMRSALLALPAAVIWNALLAYPVFGLVRTLVGTTERVERAREVELLV
jgi:rod shape-determining protein MreD